MRITRFSLAGLAVAMVGAAAREAAADNLNLTTAINTPVETSNAFNGSAGDVLISPTGQITVTGGQSAVTVDSENDVINNGQLLSVDADNSRGIRLTGGPFAPVGIINGGTIALTDSYTRVDNDADSNLDGAFATGTGRYGIHLEAGASFFGDIENTGTINIEGNSSAAIRLDSLLTGDLTSTGVINVTGDGSYGIAITGGALGGVDGDVSTAGAMNVRGIGAGGLLVDGAISGELSLSGAWTVTGYSSTIRGANETGLDPDDYYQTGPAIEVRYSIGDGIRLEGMGVEDDPDDDDDGTDDEADDNVGATIRSYSGSPALLIDAAAGNILLGDGVSGYGFLNRGNLEAHGVYAGVDSITMLLQGNGNSVDFTDGINNDRNLSATAYEADATVLYVDAGTIIDELLNRGGMTSVVTSDLAIDTAYGVYVNAGGSLPTLDNRGIMIAQVSGELGTARTITDVSDSLTTINNSGSIIARLIATDPDLTDNVVPVATGPTIAIDVSSGVNATIINQTAAIVFFDDDLIDDDVDDLPPIIIAGDILFGSNADIINLGAGRIESDVFFGAGADIFNITGGAVFSGRLNDSDGDLTLNVNAGVLEVLGGSVTIDTATFGATSEFRPLISDLDPTTITSTGDITFVAGALVTPLVPSGLPLVGAHTFLTAGGNLIGGALVERTVTGPGTPFIYNLEVRIDPMDSNSLEALYELKSAVDLNMTANQSAAYLPIIAALTPNAQASLALASLDNSADFFDAYEDLMPSFSSAAAELATTAIQQMQSASSNRLATTRLHGLNEVSVWAQEIGYGLTRDPLTANGQAYDGHGFGIAAGIDGPLDNGALFGLSASFITSEVEEAGRPDGEISASFGQLNAYLGTAMGPFDIDFVGGLGAGRMASRRFVEIGDDFSARTEGEWWAFEGHGAVRASLPMRVADWFVITPQTALTYVAMQEQGYTEEGGGASIDYEVDDAFSQRLWGDVGVEFSTRFNLRGGGILAPRVYAGYRANLIDEAAERNFRFASGGTSFTLQDEAYGDGAPLVGIGIDASNGYSTFTLAYEGEMGDQIERHSINASIRFRF